MNKISVHERLVILEKRNNRLKSLLLHDQLKYGSYSYKRLEEKMLLILNEYKINKSITLSAFSSGINPSLAIKWFIEGQKGNPNFKILYSGIKRINNRDYCEENADVIEDNDYELECVSGSWVYTTYADGKKVSIISSDLNNLKEKVSSRNLPLFR